MDKKLEYLLYSGKNGLILETAWLYTMLTNIIDSDFENKYIKIDNSNLFFKINNELLDSKIKVDKPILNLQDKITITKNDIANLKEDSIDTTVGRYIANYILLVYPFNNKIDYINSKFTIKDIESIIVDRLVDSEENTNNDNITIPEYIQFVNAVTYIKTLNNIVNIGSTTNAVVPPDGIDKFKKDLHKEFIDKYGKDVFKDKIKVLEFEKRLTEYENKYLEEHPEIKRFIDIKKVRQSRKKMFVSYGLGESFSHTNDPLYIEESLYNGYPLNKEKLNILYNDIRLGSYSRGAQTARTGVAAKIALRATSNIKVLQDDCNTKFYINRLVTKDDLTNNTLLGRYMFDSSNKTTIITEDIISKNIGKIIKLRSPLTCNSKIHFCKFCLTSNLTEDYSTGGIPLAITDVGGVLLNDSMSAMHKAAIETTNIDVVDLIN